MTRSTTIRLIGFGVVALSLSAACAASDDSGGGDGGGNVLISGNTGGDNTGGPGPGVGGSTDTGAGGSTDTGAGGSTDTGAGGTASGEVTCAGTGWSFDAGYIDTGTLCGYGWTSTFSNPGESITPPCGTAGPCFESSTALCANAVIPQGEAWVSTDEPGFHPGVIIGFNVAESKDGQTSGSYATTGSGLTLTYSYSGGTPKGERITITSDGVEYCADSPGSGAAIPWSSFAAKCYDTPPGAAFTVGSRITEVAVQLLGSESQALNISDFCITGATVQ